jgi:hypothetical protein
MRVALMLGVLGLSAACGQTRAPSGASAGGPASAGAEETAGTGAAAGRAATGGAAGNRAASGGEAGREPAVGGAPDDSLTSGGAAGDGGEPGGTVTEPVPEGAAIFTLATIPPLSSRTCPSGAEYTASIPDVAGPLETLSDETYRHWVQDGQPGASVRCAVVPSSGNASFAFEGEISTSARSFKIEGGVIADHYGTARITVADATRLSSPLASPAANCIIDTSSGALQAKPGAIWAHFDCDMLEHQPSDACAAEGYFVLENCAEE